jgi:hypothetical protein
MTEKVLAGMLEQVLRHKDRIQPRRILPRVRWR